MHPFLRSAGAFLVLTISCGDPAALGSRRSANQAVASGASVLFIGNSLTAAQTGASGEDMPAVLARMAAGRAKAFSFARAIDLGQTLQHSWAAGIPQPFLTGARQWDYVVLQEYSTLPVQDPALFYATAVTTYQPAILKSLTAGTGRLVLFENWALVDLSPFTTRATYTAALEANYARLSGMLTAPNLIAPLSRAFERVFAVRPQSYLFHPDGKHPNDAAIYLNAAVFYGLLFRESPAGLPALYLPTGDAAFLQDVAAQVLEPTGTAADAGTEADAGAPGIAVDAGAAPDAGTADDPAPEDAGVQVVPGALTSASGCASSGPTPAWAVALAALALAFRPRVSPRTASDRTRASSCAPRSACSPRGPARR